MPIDSLIIDRQFSALLLQDPAVTARITKSMRESGFDEHRPIGIWTNGAGRGRHVIVEGHQRHAAAKRAGLETVPVAYRHFANRHEALLWAAEQQANRRNTSKEAQCLAILRALRNVSEKLTREEMAERYNISTATFGRASMVLNRGSASEIAAVIEGTSSLVKTLALIKAREAQEAEPFIENNDDEGKRPKQRKQSKQSDTDANALVGAMNGRALEGPRRQEDREWPEELHELRDRVYALSKHVRDLGDGIAEGDSVRARSELRGVCEEVFEVSVAMSEAYPPGQTLTILIDGQELYEDDAKQMTEQDLKRWARCHEPKSLTEFPMTPKAKLDRRSKGPP